jgi:hypothetical protein
MKGFMHRFISRLTLTMLVGVALPFVFSTAMIAKDVPGKTASEIGFIELGHISRIDTRNHAVMIREAKSGGDDGWPNYKPGTGDIGARRGRRGRWVGLITRGGVGDPTGSRRPDKTFERKVVVSPQTVLKDREATISFEELKVGDFVQINSVMHGKNFEATEVQRYSKKGPRFAGLEVSPSGGSVNTERVVRYPRTRDFARSGRKSGFVTVSGESLHAFRVDPISSTNHTSSGIAAISDPAKSPNGLALRQKGTEVRSEADPVFPFGSARRRFVSIPRGGSSVLFLRADRADPKCGALSRRWLPTFSHCSCVPRT